MCGTCGCSGESTTGESTTGDSRTIVLQQKILAKNDDIAAGNREWLARRAVVMVNIMSSPGAGKTTLLERSAGVLTPQLKLCVIEGDLQTALDADRVRAAGCAVVQINTGVGCHLDAEMVRAALTELDPAAGSLVVIENVGNLVCPALFDLGEATKIVLASVTEGADKPVKYPHMFRQADVVVVTKIDLMPYVDFNLDRYTSDVRTISPNAQLMALSAVTGEGMDRWCEWLSQTARAPQPQPLGPG